MVAIVTGSGLGLQRGSGSVLGSAGQLGTAVLGQGGSRVTVNAANGNLVIQGRDELLLGVGPDALVATTYNSQGTFASGWQRNFQRSVGGLTGTVNTAGSTVTRITADGSSIVYTWNSTRAAYVGDEADGAYDTLTFASNQWTWTDGATRTTEIYDNANGGRLLSVTDADGNSLTYSYDAGGKVTRITTDGGEYTSFGYTGTLITSVATYTAAGVLTGTRVRYGYDGSSRLTSVTVDLTPGDNSVADGKTYVTSYTYDGSSSRIASITQSDGTSVAITYAQVGGKYAVSTLTQITQTDPGTGAHTTSVTTFTYGTGQTTVTDPAGNSTTLVYDSEGRLTQLRSPAATPGGAEQVQVFRYDASGNLIYSGPPGDPIFSNIAQNWNDLNTHGGGITTTQSTEFVGNIPVYRRATTTTPPAGWEMRLGQSQPGQTLVTPGQKVQVSVRAVSSGASSLKLNIVWRDANGLWISSGNLPLTPGATFSGGLETAAYTSLSMAAPAGAVYAELMVSAAADGTGPLNVAIAQPTVAVDGALQLPAYGYTYDANGNLLTKSDSLGNRTVNVYGSNNQLLTQTVYPAAGTALTSRYVYDAENHLVYALSGSGEVTRYIYNAPGQPTSVIRYTANTYDVSSLATTASPSEATMNAWANGISDKSRAVRTDTTYDARGAVSSVKTYAQLDSTGAGVTGTAETTAYVYDASGQLLQKIWQGSTTRSEAYVYDGLGRVLSFTDYNNHATQTAYHNYSSIGGARAVVTLANGTTRTSVYDRGGALVSVTDSGGSLTSATTYAYDAQGNLVRATDATGRSSYFVYDALNRKVADVTADGAVTVYRYNLAGQVFSTTAYDTKLSAAQITSLGNAGRAATSSVGLAGVTPAGSASDRWSWNIHDAAGRLVQTIDAQGGVVAYGYDGASRLISTRAYATRLSTSQVNGFKTTAFSVPVLPAADAANDRVTRYFYDADGREAGVLDADGYLTRSLYDEAGQKIRTIASANQAGSSLWASGTLTQLTTSVGTSANDIHNWFLYDARGTLRATIDGEGNLTRSDKTYTSTGYTVTVTRGQVLDPATLITTPPVLASLPAATGAVEVTADVYDEYGNLKTQTLTLAGGATEVTTCTYDKLYNRISETTISASSADGTADSRKAVYRYDALGRQIGTLSGIGSASLAANPTTAQVDTVWTSNFAAHATTFAYDTAGRLTSRRDAVGNRTVFYYDSKGRLAYEVDSSGGVVQYGYNSFGEKVQVTEYANRIAAGTLATLTGGTVVPALTSAITTSVDDSTRGIGYDTRGQVTTATNALNKSTVYAYNAFGEVTGRTDPLAAGVTTRTDMTYSRRGLLLTSTADAAVGGLGLSTSYAYDAFGRTTLVTDANGRARATAYDRTGAVKTQTDALNKTTSFTYDGLGRVLTMTDRNNKQSTYAYDLFGRKVTVTDPNGVVTVTTNNAYGQTVKVQVTGGETTTWVYNANGDLTSVTDGAGTVNKGYNNAGFLTSITDARGVVTSYVYGGGLLTSETVDSASGGLGLQTQWTYDGKGQVLSVTDALGVVTAYTYDREGRKLTEKVDNGGQNLTTTWSYDDAGRTLTHTSAAGRVTRQTYDNAGRLVYAIDPAGAVTSYAYDGTGQVIQTTRYDVLNTSTGPQTRAQMDSWAAANAANANITRSVYDADNRLAFTIDPDNRVTRYSYDNEGRVTMTTRFAVLHTVAGVRTLADMNSWAGSNLTNSIKSFSVYDAGGRQAFAIDGAGAVVGYSYDANGNVTQTVAYAVDYQVNSSPALPDMQTWAASNAAHARTTTFGYDTAGRLITRTVDPGTAPKLNLVTTFTYDQNGNVLSGTDPEGRITRYAYDAAGRQAYVIDPANAVTAYKYDKAGRLTQTIEYAVLHATSGNRTVAQMEQWAATGSNAANARITRSVYDAAGREAYAIDAHNAVTAYTYNHDGQVTQAVAFRTLYPAGNWALTDLASWKTANAGDTANRTTSYTYDTAGRVVLITDPLGIATHHLYDAQGRLSRQIVAYGTTDAVSTRWYYNGNGQVIRQTLAVGAPEEIELYHTYDEFGRVKTQTDGNGHLTTYTYDRAGRVLTTAVAIGTAASPQTATTTNLYNIFGERVKVTDPKNSAGYFYYDAAGRQISQVDAAGYVTDTAYNKAGEVLSVKRWFNTVTVTGVTVTRPDPAANTARDNVTAFTYDSAGRVLTSTDGNGDTTRYAYDAFGNRTAVIHVVSASVEYIVASYTYDKRGLMLSQTTPASNVMNGATAIAPEIVTAYEYNAFGDRTKMIEAQGRTEQRTTEYVYDKNSRLIEQIGDAVLVTSTTGATTSVTPKQIFTYDRRGNQVTASDANGAVTTTYYDAHDRTSAQVNAMGAMTVWTYDGNNNVLGQKTYSGFLTLPVSATTLPAPAGTARETQYVYDRANQLIETKLLGVTTGEWSGSAWSSQTGTLTSSTVYDANGNAVRQTDARGKSVYTYYDKLGRQTHRIDEAGFMTRYELDHEGNVTRQTQYATAVTGTPPTGGNPPAVPASNPLDRITEFTYDHSGQRLTETRKNVVYHTVSGNSVTEQAPADATISFEYNRHGQVTKKTEATGDATVYLYDNQGRVARMTAAFGAANAMTTQTTYDGLGNVLTTIEGLGTASARTTTYTYGAGGRLAAKTDATGFTLTYGYDKNGQTVLESYARVKSDGTSVQEANQYSYNAVGQITSTWKSTKPATTWVAGDTTTDTYYNAYGEVIARGTNTGGNLNKAQEYADYDSAGRVWRTNIGDGVAKVYGYDKNGNQTLQITSLGTTDLRTPANLAAAISATGTSKTYNIYNNRNELIETRRPNSVNVDGSITSISNVVAGSMSAQITFTDHGTTWWGYDVQNTFDVTLSDPELTLGNGSGAIHVVINSNWGHSETVAIPSGATSLGSYTFSYTAYDDLTYMDTTVEVYQDGPGGTQIQLAWHSFRSHADTAAASPYTVSTGIGSNLTFQRVDLAATALTMYVRPSGSTGGYIAVNVPRANDAYGYPIPGSFTIDASAAPFNGTPNSSWEVKYLATDGTARVVDAKSGTLSFNGSSPAALTAINFSSIPVFTAAQSGSTWQLTTSPIGNLYSSSTQTYNAFGDVLSQTDFNGNTTNFTFGVLGNLTKKEAPTVAVVAENGTSANLRPTENYYYDTSGRLVGRRDANSNLTTFVLLAGTGYGGTDALTAQQYNPDTGVITHNYNIFGNLIETNAAGAVTINTYDAAGRLVATTRPLRTSSTYTSGGILQLVESYAYDGLGQRIKRWNNVFGSGVVETTDYDLQGRVALTKTFGNQTTGYAYSWTAGAATGRIVVGQENAGYWTKTTSLSAGKTSSEQTDYFGKLLWSSDFGARTTDYDYNQSGQLTHQDNSAGQSIDYAYTLNGQLATVIDSATMLRSVYAYDANGNRIIEAYNASGSLPLTYNAYITYDALNRVKQFKENQANISYAYDANGNQRRVTSVYTTPGGTQTQDFWYKYDSMDRFTLTKGAMSGGAITTGTQGVAITYNTRGERMSATHGRDGHVETYTYSADGYLETVKVNNVLSVTRTNDVLGRMTNYKELRTDGVTWVLDRSLTYDNDNRVTLENSNSRLTSGTIVYNTTNNHYRAHVAGSGYTGADQGVLVYSANTQTQGGTTTTTNNAYSYTWWGQAKTSLISMTGSATASTTHTYDVNGNLKEIHDAGAPRRVHYRNDAFGQVLSRAENYDNAQRFFFYLNGRGIGDFGNDQLASEIDYAQQLAVSRNNTGAAPGQFTPIVGWNANFDASYQPHNPANVSQSGSSYTVSSGETLQSIALNIWGDASLWYVLAEANGLSAGVTLVAGRMLTVPGKVYNLHNGSDTFQPYNPLDALGNTHPTRPKPPQPPAPTTVANKKGCGGIGQILTAVVAIVVVAYVAPWATDKVAAFMAKAGGAAAGGAAAGGAAALGAGAAGAGAAAATGVTAGLAGAAGAAAGGLAAGTAVGTGLLAKAIGSVIAGVVGSVASQGFAIAIGNQDRLNWAAAAIAGIAGGVGGAFGKLLPGSKIATVVGRSVATNAVSQGINMAVGLQKKFDWTGMAVAGVAGGVGARVGSWAAGRYGETGATAITGAASLMAGAATRSLLTGQDFGKSVRDALPDAIASTIGNMITRRMEAKAQTSDVKAQLERLKDLQAKVDLGAAALSTLNGGRYQNAYGSGQESIILANYKGRYIDHKIFNDQKSLEITYEDLDGSARLLTFGSPDGYKFDSDEAGVFYRFALMEGTAHGLPKGHASRTWTYSELIDGFATVENPLVSGSVASSSGTVAQITDQIQQIKSAVADLYKNAAYGDFSTQALYGASNLLGKAGLGSAAELVHAAGTFIAEAKIGVGQALWGMAEGIGTLAYNVNPFGWGVYAADALGVDVPDWAPNAGRIAEPVANLVRGGYGYAGDVITGRANLGNDISRHVGNYVRSWEETARQGTEALAKRGGRLTGVVGVELASSLIPATKASKLGTASKVSKTADEAADLAKGVNAVNDAKAAESTEAIAIKASRGKIVWPPNRGFLGNPIPQTLDIGYTFDRYGGFFDDITGEFKDFGTFVSPKGTPYSARALPPGSDAKPFSTYEVLKPIPDVPTGPTAPWFNQPGLGIQHELPMPIQDLIEQGYIRRVDQSVPFTK